MKKIALACIAVLLLASSAEAVLFFGPHARARRFNRQFERAQIQQLRNFNRGFSNFVSVRAPFTRVDIGGFSRPRFINHGFSSFSTFERPRVNFIPQIRTIQDVEFVPQIINRQVIDFVPEIIQGQTIVSECYGFDCF